MDWNIFFKYFEWVAAAIALTYVIFQILQKPLMWYLAIVAAISYLFVYVHNGLYAMSAVQVYLIGAGIYGLIDWTRSSRHTAGTENAGRIMVRPFEWGLGLISVAVAVGVFFLLHYVLTHQISIFNLVIPAAGEPGDWRIWADAMLATNTMLATFFTGRRYIISWVMWFAFDIIAAILYFSLPMIPTGILFSFYVVTAGIGFYNWKRNGVWEKLKTDRK